MWPFVTKNEIEDLKARIELLEAERELPDEPEGEKESCDCGHHLIETTSLGAPRRSKMCPKCGKGYGFKHLEVR